MKNRTKHRFTIKASSEDSNVTEVLIFGSVGGWEGIDAEELIKELQAIDTPEILLRINSPGGDVFDGLSIYNALKSHPANVTTRIEGLGASIASVIALAGDQVEIAKAAFFMIHQPWSYAIGNAAELRETADLLDKISKPIAQIYAGQSGKPHNEIVDLMDAETWFTGTEAVDAGFCDALLDDDAQASCRAAKATSTRDLKAMLISRRIKLMEDKLALARREDLAHA